MKGRRINIKKLSLFSWPLVLIGLLLLWRSFSGGSQPNRAGEKLYRIHCSNCHMDQGEGLRNLIPPLAQSDYVEREGHRIACIIRNGLKDTIVVNSRTFHFPMPANPNITAMEITTIIQYIQTEWGQQGRPATYSEVKQTLDNCTQ